MDERALQRQPGSMTGQSQPCSLFGTLLLSSLSVTVARSSPAGRVTNVPLLISRVTNVPLPLVESLTYLSLSVESLTYLSLSVESLTYLSLSVESLTYLSRWSSH